MPAISPDAEPAQPTARPGLERPEDHVHSPDRDAHPAPLWDQQVLVEAGELLRALAAPVRIAIVLQLRTSERCVHELVDALGVAQPLISQHLRVLKSAGVVHGERHGREVVYRLVDEHLAHIVVDAATHAEETSGARSRGPAAVRSTESDGGQETETA
ncbi:transcriptional regulator, ArsR family [Saccharopolyspora kobensis]|uniref:ArsR family transcriptional regulator n=1 Tax=Saccharopolyspora kobensis TaxID=146035 RepID=A0A1H6E5T5_9PSEU|nr:metalloregulator ArsR/SmtB family transcription factor [Saccharopolyspora kobensis]SEG93052.1 transcriptional regulator, ArsR family [Saccharopolyspora kobensis]SFD42393.1 ArsR family transcriptional regulator [Saccharopolyspora kobensis]